ncbi:MAG: hypothetical protein FK733_15795 [Asgard group archaeon]|nr:hypothetical protein [Asgard group archaeon]
MSFGQNNKLFTWILIGLIPIGACAGILIGWAVFQGGGGDLNIQGSTTVEKIATGSAVPFMKGHPGVNVFVSGTGTGTGIGTLINQQCDVAMASRLVKNSENSSAFNSTGLYLRSFAIAKDGLAVIVNDAANSTLNLTILEIRSIFNGSITSWSDPLLVSIGLTGSIQVVVREEGSGTRDAFNNLVMGDEDQVVPYSKYVGDALSLSSNQNIFDEIESNDQAIGYVGLGYIKDGIEAVTVDSIEPTVENVLNGSYIIQRDLYFVTLGYPESDSLVWEYVNWHLGLEGQYWVFAAGFININEKRDDYL